MTRCTVKLANVKLPGVCICWNFKLTKTQEIVQVTTSLMFPMFLYLPAENSFCRKIGIWEI